MVNNGSSAILFAGILSFVMPVSGAPMFHFNAPANVSSQALAGFQAAAKRWSAQFTDNVTINIDIDFTNLGPQVLGATGSTLYVAPYSFLRDALAADAITTDDRQAISNLPSSSTVSFLTNHTAECGNCSKPYFDNNGSPNNSELLLSAANVRALGFDLGNQLDASIAFSNQYSWDFNPYNGITPGTLDFVGMATHEIGHALGFLSGIDLIDFCADPSLPCGGLLSEDQYRPYMLDLFRYSDDQGAIFRDFTARNAQPYFSIDGGKTKIAPFSTGVNFGDGSQASHWKDNLLVGIMDPTIAYGERLSFSNADIRALDVIGWNRVPEPGTFALVGAAVLLLLYLRRNGFARS